MKKLKKYAQKISLFLSIFKDILTIAMMIKYLF
jgi:hypothetical protein